MNYYVKCVEAKSEQAPLEFYTSRPPDTTVVPSTKAMVHARHILAKSEDQARKIIQKLDQGSDFSTLAKEKSTDDTTASEGGDLGWFQSGQTIQPFAAAVAGLEKGNYTKEPVHTQFGWHVILLEDFRPSDIRSEDIKQSESVKARIDWSRKRSEELLGMIKDLCGKGDAALEKTHGLRGG